MYARCFCALFSPWPSRYMARGGTKCDSRPGPQLGPQSQALQCLVLPLRFLRYTRYGKGESLKAPRKRDCATNCRVDWIAVLRLKFQSSEDFVVERALCLGLPWRQAVSALSVRMNAAYRSKHNRTTQPTPIRETLNCHGYVDASVAFCYVRIP